MDELEEILDALAGIVLDPTGRLDSTEAIQKRLNEGEVIPDGLYKARYRTLRFDGRAAARNPISQVWQTPKGTWIRFGPNPDVSTHLMEER